MKTNGKDLAGEDRSVPCDELGERRHLQFRMDDDDRDGEQRNHAELQEGRQVAARGKQQPDGNDGCKPAVADHECGQLRSGEVEHAAQCRALIDPAAAGNAQQQQYHADDGSLQHAPGAHVAHVQSDGQRYRYGGEHREGRPGTALHGIHDHQCQHGDQDDHDHEGAGERSEAAEGPQLIARHLPQAASVAAGGHEQNGHVLDAPAEYRAEQDPERSRQIAELRGQGRTHQRAGTRDGREVMSEDDPAMGRHEVAAVIETLGRRRPRGVHRQHPGGDPGGIETVTDDIDAHAGRDQPQRIDRFIAVQCDPADGEGADDRQDDADSAFEHDVPPETILGGDYGAYGLSSGSGLPCRDP